MEGGFISREVGGRQTMSKFFGVKCCVGGSKGAGFDFSDAVKGEEGGDVWGEEGEGEGEGGGGGGRGGGGETWFSKQLGVGKMEESEFMGMFE